MICKVSFLIFAFLLGCAPSSFAQSVIRVGAFPNITHAQAMVGKANGSFEKAMGPGVKIDWKGFNAGPAAIEALFAGAIDLTYIGPNPAISGYVRSNGEALRVIAGATSGGAALIVRSDAGIQKPEDFHGKRIATPQLGNTQDVALRSWLKAHGMKSVEKGGDVRVIPLANPDQLTLFIKKELDGAWAPEPWATRLIKEGNGTLFLDERTLWRDGDFVTAQVIVSTNFLKAHPGLVKAWLAAHVSVTQWALANPTEASNLVNAQIEKLTGQKLFSEVLDQAWTRQRLTWDPISASLVESANSAFAAGLLADKPNLDGIYDLSLLNQVLTDAKLPNVK